MSDIVTFPQTSRGIPSPVSVEEIHAAPEPTDRQVWALCPYVSHKERCSGCPKTEEDPDYGEMQRMCRGLAEEAARVVMATAASSQTP